MSAAAAPAIRADGTVLGFDVGARRIGVAVGNGMTGTARAVAVVEYLVSRGIPADRIAATGFGEFQPLEAGDGEEANAKNRRIELKLTER